MDKPVPVKETRIFYDYHDVIHYIEDRYNIKTRDYAGGSSHFNKWLELMNEIPPNYPISSNNVLMMKVDDELVEISREEYKERFKVIHEQFQRYQEWEKENPQPPYLDFWHWLLDNDFSNISNGCFQTLYIKDRMNELDEDDWQYEILKMIHDEFNEDEMNVWIEW